jgi:hypothetical protein
MPNLGTRTPLSKIATSKNHFNIEFFNTIGRFLPLNFPDSGLSIFSKPAVHVSLALVVRSGCRY